MKHFLFSAHLPDGRDICVAPVSVDAYEANHAYSLGDDTGYFIYEYDVDRPASGIEILAKAASYDAAMRIIDIFLAAQQHRPTDGPVDRGDVRRQSRLAPLQLAT